MKAYAVILFFLITHQIFGQMKMNWQEMELKGKVKALKTITKSKDKDTWDRVNISNVTYFFNEQGLVVSYEKTYKGYYSDNFTLESKETYEYDKMNRMVKKQVYDEDNELDYVYTYQYNKKGNVSKETKEFLPLDTRDVTRYEYDKNGNLIKKVYDDSEDIYKYNKKNQKIEEQTDFFGQKMQYFYTYDAKGNIAEMKRYVNQKPLFTNIYKYDASNRLTEDATYDKNNKFFQKDTYRYNAAGKIIEETKYGSTTVYAYDQYQNCIRKDSTKYVYTYDDEKNWLQKTTHYKSAAEPSVIEERAISYF